MGATKRRLEELSLDELMKIQESPRKRRRSEEELRVKQSVTESAESDLSDDNEDPEADTSDDPEDSEVFELEDQPDAGATASSDMAALSRLSNHLQASMSQPQRLKTEQPKPNATKADFSTLGIASSLVSALGAMSIRHPTEVRAACIPTPPCR